MATQLVPGMPGWRPDHPCFTGTKFFDFYGWRVPLLEPGLEWCALIENVKFNPYLDWAEVGSRRGTGPGRGWADADGDSCMQLGPGPVAARLLHRVLGRRVAVVAVRSAPLHLPGTS